MNEWQNFSEKKRARLNLFNIIRKPKKHANKEGLRMLHCQNALYVKTYPKNCNTDIDKFRHLTKIYRQNEITPRIFLELVDVLDFEPEKLKIKISEVLDAQIINNVREAQIKW